MAQADLHRDRLPKAQQTLWPALAEFRNAFVLYGGTALALQLGHRESVDFDFFCSRSFQPGTLVSQFPLLQGTEILQSSPDTFTVLKSGRFDAVKLSFSGGLNLARVNTPLTSADNGLKIASLLDIAGTKIKVLQDRAELKDYLDVLALLENGIGIEDAIRAAMTIYGESFNPMVSLKALTWFEDADVRKLDAKARHVLEEAVKSVNVAALRPFATALRPFDSIDNKTQESALKQIPPADLKP